MAKILITTIQVNLCSPPCFTKVRHQIHLNCYSKIFLPLACHTQPFLGCPIGFHLFSHNRGHTLFLQLSCFWVIFHFFLQMHTVKLANHHHFTVHSCLSYLQSCGVYSILAYVTGSVKTGHNCIFFKFLFIKYLQST